MSGFTPPLHELERWAWRAAQQRDARLRADPARKRAHGIVHTPPELARGVVRVLDELLRRRYGLLAGVGDKGVHFIDPACGPGAFFAALLALADERGVRRPLRLTGFDLDPEALALASELRAHPLAAGLELRQADLLDATPLLELASRSSQRLVLLGNPPWASARATPLPAAQKLLEDFRRDAEGERLVERKLGVLADVYVRFFRLCAEAARSARAGALLGLVSNASFLDGPVHRGMRAALLRWFDALFVLDLGGSALLGRSAGVRDDNVFGVRPSVAISWLCRDAGSVPTAAARGAFYARLSGERSAKLERLSGAGLDEFAFVALQPAPPALRFVPTRRPHQRYAGFVSLAQCLPFQREGVQTNRDAVAIDRDRDRLLERLRAFASGRDRALPELELAERELSHYSPRTARHRVAEALERDPDGTLGISLHRLGYRPFDLRWFCPVAPLCHRPRAELLAALSHAPLMLVSVRKDRGSAPWTHFAASAAIVDNCFLSARSSCRARAFPCCDPEGRDNLAEPLREALEESLGTRVAAREFLHYALGILAAPSYRASFDEELRQDYPRLPLPPTAASFERLRRLGERIAQPFSEPLPIADAPPPASGLCHRDLSLDLESGCLSAAGELLLELSPEALALRIGHHRPLGAYLAARRDAAVDAAALAELAEIAGRLGRLQALFAEADVALQAAFPDIASP